MLLYEQPNTIVKILGIPSFSSFELDLMPVCDVIDRSESLHADTAKKISIPSSLSSSSSDGHRLRRPPSLTANVCNSQRLSILCSQQFVVNSLPSIVCCRLYAVDYLPSIVCRQFFVIVLMLIVYSVPFILSSISSPK